MHDWAQINRVMHDGTSQCDTWIAVLQPLDASSAIHISVIGKCSKKYRILTMENEQMDIGVCEIYVVFLFLQNKYSKG